MGIIIALSLIGLLVWVCCMWPKEIIIALSLTAWLAAAAYTLTHWAS
jgi:hypothetical protein